MIGIGIDNQTQKGAREVQSSLDSIKRSSLQAGLAVGAMTGGLSLMAGNTASNIRSFSQFAEQIGASTELVAAQSEAWQRAGGSASGYLSLMERLAKMRAGVLAGNTEWISEAAKVGLNYGDMLNTAPDELLPKIIERMTSMNQKQRLNAVDMLGAEPVLSNIAVDGRGAFEEQTQKQLKRFQITKQMEAESERLLTSWSDTMSEMEALTDRASIAITPKLNEMLGSFNDFFESNRPEIHGGIDTVFRGLADNIGAVVVALAGLKTAGVGSLITKFTALGGTANGIGQLTKNIGQLGVTLAASNFAAEKGIEALREQSWYKNLTDKTSGWFNDRFSIQDGVIMPTVIEPAQVAQLETAREATRAQTYHERMASYAPPAQSNYPARKTEEHIHVHLSEREVAHFIRQVNSQDAEQAVRDLRSPIDR
ncbi:hypothetical protein [Vibrio cholerae]|uniref:hypothetical protein n=1 Tax=Vibrio cholerae TaxID=666 RepID=UPI0011AECE55|nr:hypothetical protein [Vibrio cholerae]